MGSGFQFLTVPSASDDPARAVGVELKRLVAHGEAATVARFLHGAAIATNANLEGNAAPLGHNAARGFFRVRDDLREAIGELTAIGTAALAKDGATPTEAVTETSASVSIVGQGYSLQAMIAPHSMTAGAAIRTTFIAVHQHAYSHTRGAADGSAGSAADPAQGCGDDFGAGRMARADSSL